MSSRPAYMGSASQGIESCMAYSPWKGRRGLSESDSRLPEHKANAGFIRRFFRKWVCLPDSKASLTSIQLANFLQVVHIEEDANAIK